MRIRSHLAVAGTAVALTLPAVTPASEPTVAARSASGSQTPASTARSDAAIFSAW